MPKKTDAEWKALDRRIACEIMAFVLWDELSEGALKIYWETMDEQPTKAFLAHNRKYWWFLDEADCPDSIESLRSWQPHLKAAQALMVRDEIVRRGWYFSVNIDPIDVSPLGRVAVAFYRLNTAFRARADTDAKAICLAAGRWKDAQKEKQDES